MQFCLSEASRVVVVEIGEQPQVELLNLFMALLIEGVNGTFTLGDETFQRPPAGVLRLPRATGENCRDAVGAPRRVRGPAKRAVLLAACAHTAVSDLYRGTTSTTVRSSIGNSAWARARSSCRLLRESLALSGMMFLT